MACFIVPLTQAVVTTVLRKRLTKSNSKDNTTVGTSNPWVQQLPKLELMLWGGSMMLVVDHVINNELTWTYPFFTAMEQKDGFLTMLQEMFFVGVPMSAVVTLAYIIMVISQIKISQVS